MTLQLVCAQLWGNMEQDVSDHTLQMDYMTHVLKLPKFPNNRNTHANQLPISGVDKLTQNTIPTLFQLPTQKSLLFYGLAFKTIHNFQRAISFAPVDTVGQVGAA